MTEEATLHEAAEAAEAVAGAAEAQAEAQAAVAEEASVVAEAAQEARETEAEAAVAIARVEAEAAVEIAEAQAEAAVGVAQAQAEGEAAWRAEIEDLKARIEGLATATAATIAELRLLIPPAAPPLQTPLPPLADGGPTQANPEPPARRRRVWI